MCGGEPWRPGSVPSRSQPIRVKSPTQWSGPAGGRSSRGRITLLALTASSKLWKSSTLKAVTTWWSTCRGISRPSIPRAIASSILPLSDPAVDLATLVAPILRDHERTDPSVVKMVGSPLSETRLSALYFTRATAPYGEGPLYHHIGLYAYRRKALQRFVSLPPSPLEIREKLEQLRALEAGMRIDATIVDDVPLGVDTPQDLERARAMLAARRRP